MGATLYILYSVGQWRSLSVPSWDLAIFTQLAKAYSQFQSPIVPVKGVDYNLLGDHFHPILVLLGPIYRFFPSGLTLLIVQDLLIAVSAWPLVRLATRRAGFWQALALGVAYVTAWGFQGAVASQFHEIAFAVPMLAWASAAFVEGRWRACELWALPLIFVKEDLGLTVFMVGMAIAWRRRHEGARAYGEALGLAVIGVLGFLVATQLVLPAMNPSGTWAYSLAGSEKARASLSIIERLLTPGIKYATLLILVLTAGLMGLMSPWMACVLPTMGWRYLGSVAFYWDWAHWHYNAVLVPIAACALLDVVSRWIQPERGGADPEEPARASSDEKYRRVAAWAAACVPAVSLALTASFLPLWKLPTLAESPRMAAAQGALDVVPAGTSVESDTTLLARLVPGRDVYWVGTTAGMDTPPEYVVVDRQSYAWGGAEVDAESWASAAHPGHTYETIYSAQGFRVARRTS